MRSLARLADSDDLLLFCDRALPGGVSGDRLSGEPRQERNTLLIALGPSRARLATTTRRFGRDSFASGPLVDRLSERLVGAIVKSFAQPTNERRASVTLTHQDHGRLTLEVELFGNRGLWALLDAAGRILELSRIPEQAERKLEPGLPYVPPRSHGSTDDTDPRFAPPVLAAIDAHFTAQDLEQAAQAERLATERALSTARKRLTHKISGLMAQREAIDRVPELRKRADLLLAYSFSIQRGQTSVEVPDPDQDGATLRFDLDPAKSIRDQIEAHYDRARRLEDATEIAKARLADAEQELASIAAFEQELAAATEPTALAALRTRLTSRGLLRAPQQTPAVVRKPTSKLGKLTHGESFRRFQSSEGYLILCGKSNEQNDKLSLRVAAGNDLWFHVGQGYAGSHVVMRVPKGKTASLESMLDAGTIAVHFSKARAATVCDVDYTFAKFVRKQKGLPPGKVTITQNKTLRVRIEKARIERLLAGTSGEE